MKQEESVKSTTGCKGTYVVQINKLLRILSPLVNAISIRVTIICLQRQSIHLNATIFPTLLHIKNENISLLTFHISYCFPKNDCYVWFISRKRNRLFNKFWRTFYFSIHIAYFLQILGSKTDNVAKMFLSPFNFKIFYFHFSTILTFV